MTRVMDPAAVPPEILARGAGATIAYHRTPGKSPGVVYLTGFSSAMTGDKALHLEQFCRARGQAFVRFDYLGHGASSGSLVEGTIGSWADDALAVVDRFTEGPQVLVGSSMGGWIMLLVALHRSDRVAGLLGTAAAPDFTEDLIPGALSADQRETLARTGVVYLASAYDPEPTPISKALLEDGRRHLVLRRPISIAVPVRLIHGMADGDVPWQTSLRLAAMIRSPDVEVTLVKDGDHRLSRPGDLDRLGAILEALLRRIEQAPAGP